MSARSRKRRPHLPASPRRNYLAEFQPDPDAPHPIDHLIEHDRRISRMRRAVGRISAGIRRDMKARDWIRLADVFAVLRGAEVEVAFNLGFENGFVAGRSDRRFAGRSRGGRGAVSLRSNLLRVVAGTSLPAGVTAAVLMELGSALVRRDQLAPLAAPREVQP